MRMTRIAGLSIEGREALETLQAICGGLPECVETTTFGHPTFQAGKKRTFVVLDNHEQPGMLCLVFKADRAEQARLVDGVRFGRHLGRAQRRARRRNRVGQWQARLQCRQLGDERRQFRVSGSDVGQRVALSLQLGDLLLEALDFVPRCGPLELDALELTAQFVDRLQLV